MNLGLGYMAAGIWPVHSWFWGHGPSLRLQGDIAKRTELGLNLGAAFGADSASWSPGDDRAVMGQLGVTRYLRPWLGLTGSAFVAQTGFKSGNDDVLYVGLVPAAALRLRTKAITWRTEAGPLLGLASQCDEWTFVYGGVASTYLTINW
jgi:hypothetical protein